MMEKEEERGGASVYYDSGLAPSPALLTFVISSKHCVSSVFSQLLLPSICSLREELSGFLGITNVIVG